MEMGLIIRGGNRTLSLISGQLSTIHGCHVIRILPFTNWRNRVSVSIHNQQLHSTHTDDVDI